MIEYKKNRTFTKMFGKEYRVKKKPCFLAETDDMFISIEPESIGTELLSKDESTLIITSLNITSPVRIECHEKNGKITPNLKISHPFSELRLAYRTGRSYIKIHPIALGQTVRSRDHNGTRLLTRPVKKIIPFIYISSPNMPL
ncbi:hypothetical protein ACFLYY_01610 [Patescibacteria group bacterium]